MADNDGKGGQGGQGGDGAGGEPWFNAFPEVKGNEALTKTLSSFKSPVEAFQAIGQGFGAKWREDWVASLPETDRDGALAWAQRYQSPKEMLDAARAGAIRIRSGELLKPLPANANEQEIAEYRKAHGIPEKVDGYFDKLPDGLVIGEQDLPIFKELGERLHKMNVAPAVVHEVASFYNDLMEKAEDSRAAADGTHKAQLEEAMRQEWGQDFTVNRNVLKAYLGTMPQAVQEALMDARTADGRAIFNSPDVVKFFVGLARELNSVSTLVGQDGKPPGQSLAEERAKIEKFMRTNRSEYDRDEAMQQRYRDIIDAQNRIAERSKTKAA